MKIGFIGAGKVGTTLGKYFAVHGLDIAGYFSRSESSAKDAAEFTGSAFYSSPEALVRDCGTVFVTVPDSTIGSVYSQIKDCGISGKFICHCSGSLTAAETFPDISAKGAYGCSIHPLFPVSSRDGSYKELHNAFFCLEGHDEPLREWEQILRNIGNRTRVISGSSKVRYHAACAIASNLVCALEAESVELLSKCGFSESEALEALKPLAVSNINRIFESGALNALTGPVERGDALTVRKHIDCLDTKTERDMYTAVSKKLLELAVLKHTDRDFSEIKRIFEQA